MIGAVILAAGLSSRMGTSKVMLKWGNQTVIEKIVDTLLRTGIKEIVIVTGSMYSQVKRLITYDTVKIVFNPQYANGEMVCSLKVGLQALSNRLSAAMVLLGDQPFISQDTIRKVAEACHQDRGLIIMPSFNNHRGHPWIIKKRLWSQVMGIIPPETLRDFFKSHQKSIHYVIVEDQLIIQDMDTPEDYQRLKPNGDDPDRI
jgi:molybdenum cofactor cytidylyltransferase